MFLELEGVFAGFASSTGNTGFDALKFANVVFPILISFPCVSVVWGSEIFLIQQKNCWSSFVLFFRENQDNEKK